MSDSEDYYGRDHSESEVEAGLSDQEGSETPFSGDELDALPIATLKKPLLTAEALASFNKEKDRTGLVYISRIPPAMSPSNLRQLLSPFGEIGRLYMAPDKRAEAKAAKSGKNRLPKFTEGWVEFKKKKHAKLAAEALNGRPMTSGKKHSRFAEDLWCIKYLGGDFKWSTLTERIAYERAVKEQRMREEISQARRENKAFLRQVEQARVYKKIEEKRVAKGQEAKTTVAVDLDSIKKRFRQRQPVNKDNQWK